MNSAWMEVVRSHPGWIALVVFFGLGLCSCDGARRDSIRGSWVCESSIPGGGTGADILSFDADGTYVHIQERAARFTQPNSFIEWRGTWTIEQGVLELRGKAAFSADEVKNRRWVKSITGDEIFSAKIKKVGNTGLEFESDDPYIGGCVFVRTTVQVPRPIIAKARPTPSSAPAKKPASKKCNCAPHDLECNLRCAAE